MKHRFLQKGFLILLAIAMLAPLFTAFASADTVYDHTETFSITGYNADPTTSAVIVFTNDNDSPRVIQTSDYAFRYAKVMIFDKNGVLIEAGGDLLGNKDGTNGSAQLTVTIPPRGFMVAFGNSAPQALRTCREIAMEGAMLYNATMSVIYPMFGSYDKATDTLTISYDDAETPSADAPRFLFVGNSTTYFNGTPIKFKAVCDAAGKEVVVEYCTYGSAYLSEFADPNHERGKALRNKLKNNKYDYVVLQDAASADYTRSKAALDVIMPLIEENGAEALLYMRYSTSDDGTKRHYNNYPRLSKDFGLTVANVTGAFNICREKYPDINLLADDGGHHSCEGSYLIACTWLYAYLGIDPRGTSYTANLPEDTVAALQECAYEIVEQGLELPEEDYSLTVDGVKYDNLSKDKSYTADGAVYTGDWTDADENGKPLGKRTDGIFASAGNETANGCWKGTTTNVTIDLEQLLPVKAIRTDLWGGTWGIPDPTQATVEVSYSADGDEFVSLGEATRTRQTASGEWKLCDFTLILDEEIDARYIRVTYNIAGNFCWSSEIGVYGTAPDESGRINLALGKEWYGDTGTASGDYTADLTNGVIDPEGKYDGTLWYAADKRKETDGVFTMMLDLGAVSEISETRIHAWPAGYSGIMIPASVDFYASDDGETFELIGSVTKFNGTDPQWIGVTPEEVIKARYIRVDMVGSVEGDTGVFWFVSELEVLESPDAHKHSITHVEATAPTSTQEGNIEYWTCKECGLLWKDEALTQPTDAESVVLPKLEGAAGDIDGDGKVNGKDYMMVKRYVLGTFDLTDAQISGADMDGDGKVKAKDYLMLKCYILGTWTPAK